MRRMPTDLRRGHTATPRVIAPEGLEASKHIFALFETTLTVSPSNDDNDDGGGGESELVPYERSCLSFSPTN